jgi:hypothetical protein
MKKILIAGILIAGLFSSCQDYLEGPTKSSLDESIIFSTPSLASGAIDGIKVPFGETNSYRGRFLPYYGLNTDTEWFNASQTDDAKSQLCTYSPTSTNTEMNTVDSAGSPNNAFSMMYVGIERANICIRGLRKYGNPIPGSAMGQLLGEALTLRAIYYADLVRAWGDVPARFEPINSQTLYVPKSNRDVIYKQLIADLGEAATLVAWPNTNSDTRTVERINKAFVKGLRARLALVASGYQLYADTATGVVRRTTDADLSVEKMYPLALKECREVIESGTASLESSFETLWKKYNQEVISAGGESLWEIPFADGRGRMLYTFAVVHSGTDQFQAMGSKRGGAAGPLPTVFYDFDQLDTRRNVTCVPYKYGTPVAGVPYPVAKQELGTIDTWYFGKYRFEWMNRRVTSTNDDGINKIYMRYAEILLMAAETANEIEGPAAAAPYLKLIRKRAFSAASQATKVDAYVNALTTKNAMFNAIVDEQKFEFTGEMERKQALIRWNLLKTKLDEAKVKMTNLMNKTGEYATVPANLYFKYQADGVTLDVYGLNRGETIAPVGYTLYANTKWDKLIATKINSLYKDGVNPDLKQVWPIWKVIIDGSNNTLVNDFGY